MKLSTTLGAHPLYALSRFLAHSFLDDRIFQLGHPLKLDGTTRAHKHRCSNASQR